MERLTPGDFQGGYFFAFVMIESGGALLVLVRTAFRERAKI